jgi:hypothetical protein
LGAGATQPPRSRDGIALADIDQHNIRLYCDNPGNALRIEADRIHYEDSVAAVQACRQALPHEPYRARNHESDPRDGRCLRTGMRWCSVIAPMRPL